MKTPLPFALAIPLVLSGLIPALAEDGLFEKLDANNDGFVTAEEVNNEQKGLFERLIRNVDANADGKLDRAEFTKGTTARAPENRPAEAAPAGRPDFAKANPRELFQRLDRDGNGSLAKDEAPERLREHFGRIDANGDGMVTPEEFMAAHERFAQQAGDKRGPQPGPELGRRAAEIFKSRDADGDGRLVLAEVGEEHKEKFQKLLAALGKDSVSLEEFARAMVRLSGGEAGGKPASPEVATRTPFVPPLVKALDSDANGELSSDEIAAAAKSLARLDKNGDGKLSRDELFLPPQGDANTRGAPGQFILERLKAADKDGNGSLSREEAPDFIKERFDKIDGNGNGQLETDELQAVGERLKAAAAEALQRRKPRD